jgi:hypothetical protein
MKATCKVVKVVVSDDGSRKEVIKPNLTVEKAMSLREKLEERQEKADLREMREGGHTMGRRIVSYIVEGTV